MALDRIFASGGCTRPCEGKVVILYLTAACNLRCAYCYERAKPHVPDLNSEQIASHLEYLRGKREPISTIVLFGGEPCLRWDLVRFTALHANETLPAFPNRIQFLFTNGLLLSEERLQEMSSWSMQLLLSFDGFADRSLLRYGERTVELIGRVQGNLCSAIKKRIPTTVVFALGRHNVDFVLEDMARLHDTCGVKSFSVNLLRRRDFAAAHTEETKARVFEWAARSSVDVDWKDVKAVGSRFGTFFFSSTHARYVPAGEAGTWDRTGW